MSVYKSVYENGVYYSPANKHYEGSGTVSCDKCKREDLDVCIGWKNNDLCLMCVSKLKAAKSSTKKSVKKNSIKKNSVKKRPSTKKRMRQRIFRPKSRMRQRQFRKNEN